MERARTWNGTFWRRHWSGVASALVALGAVLLPTWGCAEEPIRIGVLSSLTGPATYAGEPGPKTIQLYAKKINEAGGMLGRKLQVISYDDTTDVAKANSLGKRLLETDKVDVIIGGSTTGTAMALVPLVEARETPFITTAGGGVLVEPLHKWVLAGQGAA